MGSHWPLTVLTPLKKQNKSTIYYNVFFLQIIFYKTGLYSNIDKQTRLCLGTFEYKEADREMYRKLIKKSKQYSTTLHVWISDYFTYSIIICRSLFITVRYVTLRTSQNLTKEKYYQYYMEGTIGVHLTPRGNKRKQKINGRTQKLASVCDIVRMVLRKKNTKKVMSVFVTV
jgi:hypothetical protein